MKRKNRKIMIHKTAAIIVTYNRKELLLQNIEALLKQTFFELLDIIIIDNASIDGTFNAVKKYIDTSEITYINTGCNLGGAGGFQYGIRYAAEQDYEFVWVMDDDCIPNENALEKFYEIDNELKIDYGYLSSKVLWKDGSVCHMNCQRRTVTRCNKDFESRVVPIKMASFVSLFIPVKIVKQIGLPIKEFFIWTDDWEYTRRISKRYKCYLVNSSVVIHHSKNNIGANIATEESDRLERFRYLYRNDVYLYRREGIIGFLYEVIRLTAHILRVLFKSKDKRWQRMCYIIKGTIEGFQFKPEIEYIHSIK